MPSCQNQLIVKFLQNFEIFKKPNSRKPTIGFGIVFPKEIQGIFQKNFKEIFVI